MVYQFLFIKIYSKNLQILTYQKCQKLCNFLRPYTWKVYLMNREFNIEKVMAVEVRRLIQQQMMTSLWDDLLPDPGPCSLSLEVSCIANMPLCTGVCLLPLSVPECTMPCMHCIASGAYDSSLQRHIRDAIQIKMSHGHSALIVRWMQLMTHCTDCKRSWCYLWRLVYPTIDTTRPLCVIKDFGFFPIST